MRNASDESLCQEHLARIRSLAETISRNVTLMEICGGHTNVIMKYGIRDILPSSIKLISGPGCPVCVTDQKDIDRMVALAENGVPIATYGDMMRVPGSTMSLEQAKAKGGKVFEIYSADEVLELAKKYPDIVFFGIGFETTTPMTAFLLEHDITVYCVHKLVPPAMTALLQGEVKVDGFINPGHVSTITGIDYYKEIKAPQVVTGFTPERILRGIMILLELIAENRNGVINAYPEVTKATGNTKAQALVQKHLEIVDSDWRGLGTIPVSGLDVKDEKLNAKEKHRLILKDVKDPIWRGCRCGDVLKGLIQPVECPLYKKVCTPENPQGGCMVSDEGTCSIYYRYGKKKDETEVN